MMAGPAPPWPRPACMPLRKPALPRDGPPAGLYRDQPGAGLARPWVDPGWPWPGVANVFLARHGLGPILAGPCPGLARPGLALGWPGFGQAQPGPGLWWAECFLSDRRE